MDRRLPTIPITSTHTGAGTHARGYRAKARRWRYTSRIILGHRRRASCQSSQETPTCSQAWRSWVIAQHERELARRDCTAPAQRTDTKTDAEMLGEHVQVFCDASHEAQGDDRRMFEVDARIMKAYQSDVQVYEAAVTALRADGFVSAVGLDTREGLAKRRTLVQACIRASATLTESCRTLGERVYAEMRRNLPEPRATESAELAMHGFDAPLVLRARDDERLIIEGVDGVVALFDREFGRWHFNASKRLVFDNADAPASYARWIKQIQDASREEEGMQHEMLARAKTRLGR